MGGCPEQLMLFRGPRDAPFRPFLTFLEITEKYAPLCSFLSVVLLFLTFFDLLLFLLLCRRYSVKKLLKSFILGDIGPSKFKIFFNHGETFREGGQAVGTGTQQLVCGGGFPEILRIQLVQVRLSAEQRGPFLKFCILQIVFCTKCRQTQTFTSQ